MKIYMVAETAIKAPFRINTATFHTSPEEILKRLNVLAKEKSSSDIDWLLSYSVGVWEASINTKPGMKKIKEQSLRDMLGLGDKNA